MTKEDLQKMWDAAQKNRIRVEDIYSKSGMKAIFESSLEEYMETLSVDEKEMKE